MGKQKNKFSTGIVLLLLITLLVSTGLFFTLWQAYKNNRPTATGSFTEPPSSVLELTPAAFNGTSFLSLQGKNGTIGLEKIANYQILAVAKDANTSVIYALDESYTTQWGIELGGKLIACAQNPLAKTLLPCLYQAADGYGVTLIDLEKGQGKWIWKSTDKYVNLATASGDKIILIAQDLSLTTISPSGTLLREVILAQEQGSSDSLPNLDKCKISLEETPDRFISFSEHLYMLSSQGINIFIDPSSGFVKAKLPGRLLGSLEDGNYVVSSSDNCTRSALIRPYRGVVTMLPAGVSVPSGLNQHLTPYAERDGNLFHMNFDNKRVGKPLFPNVHLGLGKDTQIISQKDTIYLYSDSRLGAYHSTNGLEKWAFSTRIRDFALADDVLLYFTPEGRLHALSAGEGIELWHLDPPEAADTHMDFLAKQRLRFSSSQFIIEYEIKGKTLVKPQGANPVPAKAGVEFSPGECVRMTRQGGTNTSYKGVLTKTDCSLAKSEHILKVISREELAGAGNNALKACGNLPDLSSAISLTNPIYDPIYAGICMKLEPYSAEPTPGKTDHSSSSASEETSNSH